VTVIEGNLQAMLDDVYDRSDETLQSTLDRAEGLHRLVEDIRDLSLADVGKLDLSIEQVSLGRVLEDAASAMRSQSQAKSVALESALSPGTALADEARLRQVLANLLDNAVRHTPAGGLIAVRSGAHDDGTCWIEVADTGEGIPAEDLPHIFDRFYRGSDASGRKTRGSGLGLAIARALITAMDGQLTATSTPGEGSTFRIELPAANDSH
jgi:signal transduction histidine kinase